MIDVGHTPDGIRQSLASLQAVYGAQGWILVAGASLDKKIEEIVGALAASFDTIVATKAQHKGGDAENIAAAVRRINPRATVHVAATIADAFSVSQTLAKSLNRKIYVAGGLFTAIEFAVTARGGRAQDLIFF